MKKLTIALVAHDNRKADMVEWAIHNAEFSVPPPYRLYWVQPEIWFGRRSRKKGLTADIACMHSGPLGGDAEIAAMVVRKEIDLGRLLDRRLESAAARGRYPDVASPVPCP